MNWKLIFNQKKTRRMVFLTCTQLLVLYDGFFHFMVISFIVKHPNDLYIIKLTINKSIFNVFIEMSHIIWEFVSWITIELIFKVILFRFLFPKIMIWNFLGFAFKELVLKITSKSCLKLFEIFDHNYIKYDHRENYIF